MMVRQCKGGRTLIEEVTCVGKVVSGLCLSPMDHHGKQLVVVVCSRDWLSLASSCQPPTLDPLLVSTSSMQ